MRRNNGHIVYFSLHYFEIFTLCSKELSETTNIGMYSLGINIYIYIDINRYKGEKCL